MWGVFMAPLFLRGETDGNNIYHKGLYCQGYGRIDTVWEISATAHPCLDKGRKALENYGR